MRIFLKVFLRFLLYLKVKFQFCGLKSFVMGFKLKEIVFYSIVFISHNSIYRLCTFFNGFPYIIVYFFVTFDKLKLVN